MISKQVTSMCRHFDHENSVKKKSLYKIEREISVMTSGHNRFSKAAQRK